MRIHLAVTILSAVALVAPAAQAASVFGSDGVYVNNGGGFRKAASGATVTAGDSVMIRKGGDGRIVYENGCSVTFKLGQVVPVITAAQCAQLPGQTISTATGPAAAGGLGSGALAVGVIGVGAGVGILLATKGKSTSP